MVVMPHLSGTRTIRHGPAGFISLVGRLTFRRQYASITVVAWCRRLYLVVEEIGHVPDIAGGNTSAFARETPLDWNSGCRAGGRTRRLHGLGHGRLRHAGAAGRSATGPQHARRRADQGRAHPAAFSGR